MDRALERVGEAGAPEGSGEGAMPLSRAGEGDGADAAVELGARLHASIADVVQGQDQAIRWLLAAFLAGGHVLIDDVPGTGKTTLAKTLARVVDLRFQRVQFTPDLLPADILGASVYEPARGVFRVREGPVFTDILLADELNRASPRVQSALLEAMAERQVTLDGDARTLGPLFFVLATQNPWESHGTFPLPESQLDRFALRFALGRLAPEVESRVVRARLGGESPLEQVHPVAGPSELLALRERAGRVRVSDEVVRYVVALTGGTRADRRVQIGASTRATIDLLRMMQALACLDGRDFVTPDDAGELAVAALAHRVLLTPEAVYEGQDARRVVAEVLERTPAPA